MKKTLFILGLAAMAAMPVTAQQSNQGASPRLNPGVGPAMSGSMEFRSLPENAQTFINTLFPSTTVARVENDFKDREYEVKMSDGYEITFDYNGNWTQVEAPEGVMLPSSTLVAMVPEQVVITALSGNDLAQGGGINYVEEIEAYPEGYMVEYATASDKGKVAVSKNDGSVVTKGKKAFLKHRRDKTAAVKPCCKDKHRDHKGHR